MGVCFFALTITAKIIKNFYDMILYIKEKENQILELKNQNKNSKQKYSNEISILK